MSANNIKNKLKASTAFSLFVALSLCLSIIVSTLLVGSQTDKTIREYQASTAQTEAQLSAHYLQQFIDTRLQLLHDLAKQPTLINGVMGSDMSMASLSDFMNDYYIVGKKQPLWLYNILLETRYSNTQNSHSDSESKWLNQLLMEDIEQVVTLKFEQQRYFFKLAVPVKYNGLTEGVLVVQFSKSLNELLADVLNSETYGVTIKGPWLTFSSLDDDINYRSIVQLHLGQSQLKLNYHLNAESTEQKVDAVIVNIVVAIITSLLISWIVLFLVGQKLLLNPFK